jgi:hypothetical protein
MTTKFMLASIAVASLGMMIASSETHAVSLAPATLDAASAAITVVEPAYVRRGVGVRRGVVVGRPVARRAVVRGAAVRGAVRRCAAGVTC